MTPLQRENAKFKTLIGDLKVEHKKKRRGVGMKRSPYAKVGVRNYDLVAAIRRIKADHPFWSYRCVWAYFAVCGATDDHSETGLSVNDAP